MRNRTFEVASNVLPGNPIDGDYIIWVTNEAMTPLIYQDKKWWLGAPYSNTIFNPETKEFEFDLSSD